MAPDLSNQLSDPEKQQNLSEIWLSPIKLEQTSGSPKVS